MCQCNLHTLCSCTYLTTCFIHLQTSIWLASGGEVDRNDDVTEGAPPSLHHIVGMLVHIEHVQQQILALIQLACHLGDESSDLTSGLERLSLSNSRVALSCNELAASLLTVVKSVPCTTSKELSGEVQSLSHDIVRAGKNLNHLLKKRRVSKRTSTRLQPQVPSQPPTGTTHSKAMAVVEKDAEVKLVEKRKDEFENGSVFQEQCEVDENQPRSDADIDSNTKERKSGLADDSSLKHCKTWSSIEESLEEPANSLKSFSDGKIAAIDDRELTACVKLSKSCEPLTVTGLKYSEMSNATGQVISESPSNSPPHLTHPQNGIATATIGSIPDDEEDSSII